MATFKLEVITPHKKVLSEEAKMIIVRTTEGDLGIMARHAPLVTELAIGEMLVKKDEGDESYFVSGGFLEVSREKVLILADDAINAKNIDIEQAKRDKEIQEAKLKKLSEDRDIAATQKALNESLAKIDIGSKF